MGGSSDLDRSRIQLRDQRVRDDHVESRIATGVLESDGVVDPFILRRIVKCRTAPTGVSELIVRVVTTGHCADIHGSIVHQVPICDP